MNAISTEKRNLRGYKVKDRFYTKAKKRASKENGSLANLIECVVIAYSYGCNIVAESAKSNGEYITLDEVVATYLLSPKSKK